MKKLVTICFIAMITISVANFQKSARKSSVETERAGEFLSLIYKNFKFQQSVLRMIVQKGEQAHLGFTNEVTN